MADYSDVDEIDIAKLIGAESTTPVKKLLKMETQKVPASLFAGISRKYGEQYVRAYRELMMQPTTREAINALPSVTALAAKLAASAKTGGGVDHQALAGMQAELREVEAVVSALRARSTELGVVG